MNRCTGHCCEKFSLPLRPTQIEDLRRQYNAGLDLTDPFVKVMVPLYEGEPRPSACFKLDFRTLHWILFDAQPIGELPSRDVQTPWETDPEEPMYDHKVMRYTCRLYDKEKQICSQYESRPDVCRSHPTPDMGRCPYKGCTLNLSYADVEVRLVAQALKEGAVNPIVIDMTRSALKRIASKLLESK